MNNNCNNEFTNENLEAYRKRLASNAIIPFTDNLPEGRYLSKIIAIDTAAKDFITVTQDLVGNDGVHRLYRFRLYHANSTLTTDSIMEFYLTLHRYGFSKLQEAVGLCELITVKHSGRYAVITNRSLARIESKGTDICTWIHPLNLPPQKIHYVDTCTCDDVDEEDDEEENEFDSFLYDDEDIDDDALRRAEEDK